MRSPYIDTELVVDRRSPASRALTASAFLMRLGYVGASVFAIAIIALFKGNGSPAAALASAIAGGLIAGYAWRRSWTLLSEADSAEPSRSEPWRAVAPGSAVGSTATR